MHSSSLYATIFPSYVFQTQPKSLSRSVSLQDFQSFEDPASLSKIKHRRKSRKETKRVQEHY